MDLRIGTGYDVHRFAAGRPLSLGGVNVPFEKGLLGHSDADVLLHAIGDALLGALALGDLGKHFPDTDPQFENADSKKLLSHIHRLVKDRGYKVVNLDAVVVAERPKIAPHLPAMRTAIAGLLNVALDQVSIKATTSEGLGFIGREEGIAANAVVLLKKD